MQWFFVYGLALVTPDMPSMVPKFCLVIVLLAGPKTFYCSIDIRVHKVLYNNTQQCKQPLVWLDQPFDLGVRHIIWHIITLIIYMFYKLVFHLISSFLRTSCWPSLTENKLQRSVFERTMFYYLFPTCYVSYLLAYSM